MPTPPGGRDLFGGYPFFGPNGRASPMPTPLGGRDLLGLFGSPMPTPPVGRNLLVVGGLGGGGYVRLH